MTTVLSISTEDILQEAKLSRLMPTLIEGILTRKVLATAAKENEIEIETEELQQVADNFRQINNLEQAEDTHAWLKQHDLTLDDFEQMLCTSITSSKLAEKLFGDRVEAYFAEHELDYWQAALYEIIFEDEDLAQEYFYAISEGEVSYHDVAYEHLEEPKISRAGGYQGIVNRVDLKPEISAEVFAAEPPQVLSPVVTAAGVHLIKVESLVQPQLDEKLRLEILSMLFTNWMKEEYKQLGLDLNT